MSAPCCMGSAAYGKWMCTCAAKTSLEKRVANLEKQVRDLIKKKKTDQPVSRKETLC